MKIQIKTLVILISSFIIVIGLIFAFISVPLSKDSYENFYLLLKTKAYTVAEVEVDNGNREELEKVSLPKERDFFIKLSKDSTLNIQAKHLNLPPFFFQELNKNGEADHQNGSYFYKGILYPKNKPTHAVIVGAEDRLEYLQVDYLKKTSFVAIFCSLIFSIFISIFLSK